MNMNPFDDNVKGMITRISAAPPFLRLDKLKAFVFQGKYVVRPGGLVSCTLYSPAGLQSDEDSSGLDST